MKFHSAVLVAVLVLSVTLDAAFGKSCGARCVSTEQCLKLGPDCRCIAFQCRTIGDGDAEISSVKTVAEFLENGAKIRPEMVPAPVGKDGMEN